MVRRSTIGRLVRVAAFSLTAGSALSPWIVALADSPLADAIENGRRDAALELIAGGADVNAAQGDDTTPLHWAAYQLDAELVRTLVDHGAKAGTQNRFGVSPLSEAVKAANAPIAEMLLKAGADAKAANGDGETTLMLAARTGSVDVAKKLIAAGADVNAHELWREQTALMWAADGAYPDLVKLLIGHGADVRARATANDWGGQITNEPRAQYRPTGGLTPLLYAARSGCVECVRAILGAGEDVDRPTPDGTTALMVAIDNFELDTAKALLDAGANPHVADWWGRTALYLAVDMNSYKPRTPAYPKSKTTTGMDLVTALLAAGVAVNPQLNMHRPGRGGNSARFVDDLLTVGATPLLRAAIMHDNDALRALLAAGARVDLPNVMGVTPLMAAAAVGVREPGFGANRAPDFASKQIEAETISSIEILLAAGADVNASITDLQSRTARIARQSSVTDRQGQSALHSAAGRGWADVVAFLLAHGANAAARDDKGKTPLDLATTPVQGRPVPNSERIAEMLKTAAAPAIAQAEK
ncbi:MAG TPA: ankyrin repeat domain-containing protein [Gammaproteobacteria bacterium]|nr:ankyrin repeat domain-containing protein [Gammaproteobacteria bacterium]